MATLHKPLQIKLPAWGVLAAESVHGPEFRMQVMRDGYHELIYVLKGSVHYHEADQEPLTLEAGSLIGVCSGTAHRLRDIEAATLLLLCFDPDYTRQIHGLEAIWVQVTRRRHRVIHLDSLLLHQFESDLRRMILEQKQRGTGYSVAAQACALNLLAMIAKLPDRPPIASHHARIDRVREMLEATFFEIWSLDRAAEMAGVSRRLFSWRFRELTGKSFLNYLTDLRLEHAAHLMRSGSHTIMGAAFSSGFNDLAHFYRIFRRRYGVPPGAWIGSEAP